MNITSELLKHPHLAINLLTTIDENILIDLGKKKALNIYHRIKKTKAYKDLLAKKKLSDISITNWDDFKKIPVTDKHDYISAYPLEDVLSNPVSAHYTIERSSGYSGQPFFWPRSKGDDGKTVGYVELGFLKAFSIDKRSTLVINTFALGVWVTGMKFGRIVCELADNPKYNMSVVNVGTNLNDSIQIISRLSKYYDQVILVGYPPFVKELIEICIETKALKDVKDLNFILGGEGFPENYRTYMYEILKKHKVNNVRIFSAYGAADTGVDIGYEQDITILLRQYLIENPSIRKEVLGNSEEYVPHFFQYNPMNLWIECSDESELLYTANSGIPLVRYNIHDKGGIITYKKMMEILSKKYNVLELEEKYNPLHLPVVYVYGRTDGTIIVAGANIYIEQIKDILLDINLQKYLTGRFQAYSEVDEKCNNVFKLRLEVRSISNIEEQKEKIEKKVISLLSDVNNEYKNAFMSSKEKARPVFEYFDTDSFSALMNDSIKIKYKS